MADWLGGFVSIVVFAAYPACLIAWYRIWSRRSAEGRLTEPLLQAESRPAPFWTLADVIVMVGLFLIATGLATGLGQKQGWISSGPPSADNEPIENRAVDDSREENDSPDDDVSDDGTSDFVDEDATDGPDDASPYSFAAIILHSLTSVVVTVSMLAILIPRRSRAMQELGVVPRRGDVRLGALAALLILPPVTVVMQLSTWWIRYEHPVLEQLQSAPGWPIVAALFVSSVVIAPLTEEFVFRGLLQGALQRLADPPEPDQTDWVPRAAWPVVLTSFLFAMMHYGQGPAPIPLFFLALGLGYLYRQTGSLIPPLIVHMILNGVTMTVTISELLR